MSSQYINLPLTGGGGGGGVTSVTASTPLASSGGATPNISLTGVIPLANGGSGLTSTPAIFTTVPTTGSLALTLTPTSSVMIFQGTSSITINGMVANPSVYNTVEIINLSPNNSIVTVGNTSPPTASNRFNLLTSPSHINGNAGGGALKFYYNNLNGLNAWILLGADQAASPSSPGYVSSNQQTFNGVKTFSSSINIGTPADTIITTYTDGSLEGQTFGTRALVWGADSHLMGLQTATPTGVVHSLSATPITIGTTSVSSYIVIDAEPLTPPNTPTTTQNNIAQVAFTISATQDGSGTGYTANGSVYTWHWYALSTDGINFTPTYSELIMTDDNSGNPFQWDLNWDPSWVGTSMTILLDINGGGFNVARIVPSGTGSTIDNNDFTDSTTVTPNAIDGYFALGLTHNYNAYVQTQDLNGLTVYSTNTPYSFTDNTDMVSYYQVEHDPGSTMNNSKVTSQDNGNNGSFIIAPSTPFFEGPFDVTGNLVLTPTFTGYATDGATRYYGAATFTIVNGIKVYAGAIFNSATDFGSFPFYGVQLVLAPPTALYGYKILISTDGGVTYSEAYETALGASTFIDYPYNTYNGNTSVQPNSYLPPPVIAEGNFDSSGLDPSNLPANILIKTDSNTATFYNKIDFQDGNSTSRGSVIVDASGLNINAVVTNMKGNASVSGELDVTQNASFATNLSVGAGLSITGSSTFNAATYNGSVAYNGNITGNITVNGNVHSNSNLIADIAVYINPTPTIVNGSVSGFISYLEPFLGGYRKFVIDFGAFHDAGRTITFPTGFSSTPFLYGAAGPLAICSATATTLTIASTGGGSVTGYVFCEGT